MRGRTATWLVARREMRERARSKAFLVSTIVTVVLLAVVVVVAAIADTGPPHYDVALVAESPPNLEAALDQAATASNAFVDLRNVTDPEAVADALESGDIDAAIRGDDTILLGPDASKNLESILQLGLRQSRLLLRLDAAGIEPALVQSIFGPDTGITVVRADSDQDPAGEGIAFATIVLLFLVITTYGQWVLMGVLEEKSTRVVELVVSSTSVRSLLAGKVIGIGVLGLAQLVILITLGLAAGPAFDLFEIPGGTAATIAWSLVWFVLGFAFYAVLNAAAGSLVSRTEDAQAAATPIALLAVASYLITFTVIMPNPDGTLSKVLSLVPTIAPIAFPARIGFTGVPTWEIALGVVIMTVAVVAVVRLSARVYAGAILTAGGKVKIREA